jgi:hypothetical protein
MYVVSPLSPTPLGEYEAEIPCDILGTSTAVTGGPPLHTVCDRRIKSSFKRRKRIKRIVYGRIGEQNPPNGAAMARIIPVRTCFIKNLLGCTI